MCGIVASIVTADSHNKYVWHTDEEYMNGFTGWLAGEGGEVGRMFQWKMTPVDDNNHQVRRLMIDTLAQALNAADV